jgi:hypothetical protein
MNCEYLYETIKLVVGFAKKICDRPVELSGVERMAPPSDLTLPVLAWIGLTKIEFNSWQILSGNYFCIYIKT